MPSDAEHDGSRLDPDEAFAALGDETRLRILRELGRADGPRSFSRLRDAVGVADSGRFSYHLGRLTGQFVAKSEEGYELRRAGRRVVEAVLSGAVTDDPTLDRTPVDESCEYCGAPIEVRWREGSLEMYCTECPGAYDRSYSGGAPAPAPDGYLGRLPLPPAGVRDRSPTAALRAAWIRGNLEILSMAAGVCPRCSAPVERSVRLCEDHAADGGRCDRCGDRHGIGIHVACTNCIFEGGGAFVIALAAETDLLALLTDHGLNPIDPESLARVNRVHEDYGEELLSTDPFRARFSFEIGAETLALTVGEDLRVVGTTRRRGGD